MASGTATVHGHYLSQKVVGRDRVLFHGPAVAAVAARSKDIAEVALDLIEVADESRPFVLDPAEAMRSAAVRLHDDTFMRTTGTTTAVCYGALTYAQLNLC